MHSGKPALTDTEEVTGSNPVAPTTVLAGHSVVGPKSGSLTSWPGRAGAAPSSAPSSSLTFQARPLGRQARQRPRSVVAGPGHARRHPQVQEPHTAARAPMPRGSRQRRATLPPGWPLAGQRSTAAAACARAHPPSSATDAPPPASATSAASPPQADSGRRPSCSDTPDHLQLDPFSL